jgi:hypothetical protein
VVHNFSELLAHRALNPPPSSSLAEERTPLLAPPPCDGRAIPDTRSWLNSRAPGRASIITAVKAHHPRTRQPTVSHHNRQNEQSEGCGELMTPTTRVLRDTPGLVARAGSRAPAIQSSRAP